MSPLFAEICASSAAIRPAIGGIAEALGPDRDQRRPGIEQVGGVARAGDAPHADDRHGDARGDRAHLRERDGADRRAGQAAGPAAEPRRARPRRMRGMARRVLISDTASAPAASAASATRATSAVFGVSFTISGLAVRGRTSASIAPSSAGSAPMSSPVFTFGQETFSSIAATSSRASTASTSGADLGGGRAHHVGDQRHRQLGELGQVVLEVAAQALVGQPDRVDHPGRRLAQPRRRVALARLERDRLGDEGREREVGQQRVAEDPARRDRVEGARAVDDRVGELDAAERGQCAGTSAIASPARTGRRRTGARSRRRPAGRRSRSRRRSRRPSPTRGRGGWARRAAGTARARPRASAAARRRRRSRRSSASSSAASSSVTRPWWPSEPSSVATRALASSSAPGAWAASRKPSSAGAAHRRRAARPARWPAARCRPRRRTAARGVRRRAARTRSPAARSPAGRRPARGRTAGRCPARRPRA